jgi:hypothetical protein
MPGKINVILDIDNTIVEKTHTKDGKWAALPEAERAKYKYVDEFVLRPHFKEFFQELKKLAKSINLWTWSDDRYAKNVKRMIEAETGVRVGHVWSEAHAQGAEDEFNGGKDLRYIWKEQGVFQPCDTVLIDDLPGNVESKWNYQNGIRVKPFALWGRVKHSQPYGPYQDLSNDRTLLEVIDALKKLDASSDFCPPGKEWDEGPFKDSALQIGLGRKRRTRKRKLTRRASRRYATARTGGAGRS